MRTSSGLGPEYQQASAPIMAQSCPSLLQDMSLRFLGGRLRILIGTGEAKVVVVRLSSPWRWSLDD
jgi:hypothetical protein